MKDVPEGEHLKRVPVNFDATCLYGIELLDPFVDEVGSLKIPKLIAIHFTGVDDDTVGFWADFVPELLDDRARGGVPILPMTSD